MPTTTTTDTDTTTITARTKSYYDTPTSNTFYTTLWGGSDLHIGIYDSPLSSSSSSSSETIALASQRTINHLVSRLPPLTLTPQTRVLDLGAGYGGVARYLAGKYGCSVTCVNLSGVQNERNRELCRERGLLEGGGELVRVVDGSFEDVPLYCCDDDDDHDGGSSSVGADGKEQRFHVVWSQDSFLHSGDRAKVMSEIDRLVVKEGGWVIFTDIIRADGVACSELDSVLGRLPIDDLGTVQFYREELERKGFVEDGRGFEDLTRHFVRHYAKVLEMLSGEEGRKVRDVGGADWVQRTMEGTRAWVEAGEKGSLVWGVLCFVR